jgi:hypothetical protein
MPKITSGNLLSSAEYDTKTRTLTLGFQRGGTYTYPDVPAYLYTGLLDAESPGTFFHKNIRNQFKGTKLEPTDAPKP